MTTDSPNGADGRPGPGRPPAWVVWGLVLAAVLAVALAVVMIFDIGGHGPAGHRSLSTSSPVTAASR